MAEFICESRGAAGAAFACSRCKAARCQPTRCKAVVRTAWKARKPHCRPALAGITEQASQPALPTAVASGSAWSALLPECLQVIDAGKRGRALAAKRCFDPGQEIAREFCLAWASSHTSAAAAFQAPAEGPVDAAHELKGLATIQDAASLVLASLLLQQGKSSKKAEACERTQRLSELCAGPKHWLELPDMRRVLEERCASVQRLLAAGRSQGRWTLQPSDADVMDMDLRRIGSNVTPSSVAGCRVPLSFSLLNHSCSPNAALQWHGPEAVLICLRPIKAGDEVCISYINELDGVLGRRYFLLEQQGFRCLCARCQANFSGVGEDVLSGWLCQNCKGKLREEAIKCPSCNVAVTKAARCQRQMREERALQLVNSAAQTARSRGPAAATAGLQQAVQELQAIRPEGSTWLVKVLTMLHACLTQMGARSEAAIVAGKLSEQRAAQREALHAEASAMPLEIGSSGDDVWARRLVAALRVHEPTNAALQRGRKRHVGPPMDGGYVVWDTGSPLCNVLLSYGVDTNVDFEAEMAAAGAKVLLFDHTVPGPPRQHPNFNFKREALADENIQGVAGTLEAHIAGHNGTAMLKVDVEGAEFAVLLVTPHEVLSRFEQVCIELHWLGRPTRGGDFRSKALALERLNEHFVLLHAHGNSYGDVMQIAGCPVPDVLEALYVNRRLLGPGDVRPSCRGIPDPALDVNNCAFLPDIALQGPPFGADVA